MIILHDPATLKHCTIEFAYGKVQKALECPERIQSIVTALSQTHHDVRIINKPAQVLLEILHTHDANYLDHLASSHAEWVEAGAIESHESILPECFPFPTGVQGAIQVPKDVFARAGYYAFDMSTGIMSETYNAALASANLAKQGATLLLAPTPTPTPSSTSQSKSVLALCRPPGHHCDTRRAGGYCYINNAVVAVSTLRTLSSNPNPNPKIAILDLDFHHGNGTQTVFYADPSILYLSIHGENEFPYYTGSVSETGSGEGVGYNLNLPLPMSSSFETYLIALSTALSRIEEFIPDFLIVSLGFDTFCLDPIGNFKIDTADYEEMARRVRGAVKVPALIVLEGGYVVERLGENVCRFLSGWEGAEREADL